jgi:hypothetical protein
VSLLKNTVCLELEELHGKYLNNDCVESKEARRRLANTIVVIRCRVLKVAIVNVLCYISREISNGLSFFQNWNWRFLP